LPQLSRISPGAGLGRLFSKQALANFAKGLAKLAVFGAVIGALLWPQRQRIIALVAVDPAMILPFTRALALKMLGTVVAILAIVAAADYLFQYRQWYDRHKMSFREMKEESARARATPRSRASSPIARGAGAQAHDVRGAEGLRRHHQPDPLCHRPAIRARHERAALASPRAPI